MARLRTVFGRAAAAAKRLFRGGSGMGDRLGRDPNATGNRGGEGY